MKTTLLLSLTINTPEFSNEKEAIEGLTYDLDYFLKENHWNGQVLTCDPIQQKRQHGWQVPIRFVEKRA